AERLRAHSVDVTVFHETNVNAFRILSGLRKLISEFQPDIVHTHRLKENILGSVANRLSRNVPSVRTVHGANEHGRTLFRRVLSRLNHWCGAHLQQNVIAVSNDMAEKLMEEFPRAKPTVIENGVDIEALRAQIDSVNFRIREPQ